MLAKRAIEAPKHEPTVEVPFSRSVLNVYFRKELGNLLQTACNESDKSTDTFKVINKVSWDFVPHR